VHHWFKGERNPVIRDDDDDDKNSCTRAIAHDKGSVTV
jgi:hypothetical protein